MNIIKPRSNTDSDTPQIIHIFGSDSTHAVNTRDAWKFFCVFFCAKPIILRRIIILILDTSLAEWIAHKHIKIEIIRNVLRLLKGWRPVSY